MDSPKRTIAKAITWQVTGLGTMTLLGLLLTGDVTVAGGIAVASAGVGSVSYIVHERVWSRVRWGLSTTVSHDPSPR